MSNVFRNDVQTMSPRFYLSYSIVFVSIARIVRSSLIPALALLLCSVGVRLGLRFSDFCLSICLVFLRVFLQRLGIKLIVVAGMRGGVHRVSYISML